jgi:hypothetical protein
MTGTINFDYDTEYDLYVSDPVAVPQLGISSTTFRFEKELVDTAGLPGIRAAIDALRSSTTDLIVQATPYVYQLYKLYFDMADKYDWEQYLPDLPEAEVWSLVNEVGSWCTVVREDDHVLIAVECDVEWDVEHGMMMVYQDGATLVKVGSAAEAYTNVDGSIFSEEG